MLMTGIGRRSGLVLAAGVALLGSAIASPVLAGPSPEATTSAQGAQHLYLYNYLNLPPLSAPPGGGAITNPAYTASLASPATSNCTSNWHAVSLGDDNNQGDSYIGVSDVHTDLTATIGTQPNCFATDAMTVAAPTANSEWLEFGTVYDNFGGNQEDFWYGYYCGPSGYACGWLFQDGPVSRGDSNTFYLYKEPGTSQWEWQIDGSVLTGAQAPWLLDGIKDQIYLESYQSTSVLPYADFSSMKADLPGGNWINWSPSGPSTWAPSPPMCGNYLSNTSAWTDENVGSC
jgi:hypothetical protein